MVEQLPIEQPAGESVQIDIALTDGAFIPSEIRIPATEVIVLRARNAGMFLHQISLARLPDGYDPVRLATEEAPPDALMIGGIYGLWPGQEANAYLVGLEPGVYTLLCFWGTPDGTSHVVKGEIGQLIVE